MRHALSFWYSLSRSLEASWRSLFLRFSSSTSRSSAATRYQKASNCRYPHVVPWILLFSRFSSPLAFRIGDEGDQTEYERGSRTLPDHIVELLLQLCVLFVCVLEHRLLV